ncbi:hypothetical protein GCM10010307_81680 [Streptomyces vastus]|uniref:Transposase IS4-like domain-containing protein n=1 Tax=Streptomyces vastus TaxID=285451 RepID=A0ABN3RXY9_9ACTN
MQRHNSICARPLLERIRVPRAGMGRPRCRPDQVIADKAYSSPGFRVYLRKRGIGHTIPEKGDQQRHRHNHGSRGGRPPTFDRQADILRLGMDDEITLKLDAKTSVTQRVVGIYDATELQASIYLDAAKAPEALRRQITLLYATGSDRTRRGPVSRRRSGTVPMWPSPTGRAWSNRASTSSGSRSR